MMLKTDRSQIRVTGATVGTLHLFGWGLLIVAATASSQHALSVGMGLTAYLFGMRHAFDADHIAAIDNASRKLLSQGKRPITGGLFFSLGHCTVVLLLTAGLALITAQLGPQLADANSPLRSVGTLFGGTISAAFLFLIAAINVAVLRQTLPRFRRARGGGEDPSGHHHLLGGGLMNRLFGRRFQAINHSWQLYPIGFLFGLGFDTASEIGLLALAVTAASSTVSFTAVLSLPLLFAAGMTLFDSADAIFMVRAYSWAFSSTLRKLYYNLTMTALSVAVAVLVGMVEICGVIAAATHLHSGPLAWAGAIDLNLMGIGIVGLFVITWTVAWAWWRHAGWEEKVPVSSDALAEVA